jgi:class 3 adenylate cyclase
MGVGAIESPAMTRVDEHPEAVRRLVVVFDICSSTSILEELKRRDNMHVWRNLLIEMKGCMEDLRHHEIEELEIYKFVGDGWILLLPEDISKESLKKLLSGLSAAFIKIYHDNIRHLLERVPQTIGLTFGVDDGELVRLEMNNQIEYIGRPINVAARLQDAVKKLPHPEYTALFSMPCFNALLDGGKDEYAKIQRVELRNITGGENYDCISVDTNLWWDF